MKKKKFNMKKYADMHDEKEIAGKDEVVVTVRNHIPYVEKEEMARDLAEHMLMIHDDSCVYVNDQYRKYEIYLIAKYYTNINTDGAEIDDVANFIVNNDMLEAIEEYIFDDYIIAERIYNALEKSVRKTYEDDKSITKALRTSFGFLFTGEDITDSLAKAEATKGTLVDALEALQKVEKSKQETIDDGKLSVGGNIINFAKRE